MKLASIMNNKLKKSLLLMCVVTVSGLSTEVSASSGKNKMDPEEKMKPTSSRKHREVEITNYDHPDVDSVPGKDEILFGNPSEGQDIRSTIFQVLLDHHLCMVKELGKKPMIPESFARTMNTIEKVLVGIEKKVGIQDSNRKSECGMYKDFEKARREKREKIEKIVVGDISDEDRQGLRDAIKVTLDRVMNLDGLKKNVPSLVEPLEELRSKLKQLEVDVEDRPTNKTK